MEPKNDTEQLLTPTVESVEDDDAIQPMENEKGGGLANMEIDDEDENNDNTPTSETVDNHGSATMAKGLL